MGSSMSKELNPSPSPHAVLCSTARVKRPPNPRTQQLQVLPSRARRDSTDTPESSTPNLCPGLANMTECGSPCEEYNQESDDLTNGSSSSADQVQVQPGSSPGQADSSTRGLPGDHREQQYYTHQDEQLQQTERSRQWYQEREYDDSVHFRDSGLHQTQLNTSSSFGFRTHLPGSHPRPASLHGSPGRLPNIFSNQQQDRGTRPNTAPPVAIVQPFGKSNPEPRPGEVKERLQANGPTITDLEDKLKQSAISQSRQILSWVSGDWDTKEYEGKTIDSQGEKDNDRAISQKEMQLNQQFAMKGYAKQGHVNLHVYLLQSAETSPPQQDNRAGQLACRGADQSLSSLNHSNLRQNMSCQHTSSDQMPHQNKISPELRSEYSHPMSINTSEQFSFGGGMETSTLGVLNSINDHAADTGSFGNIVSTISTSNTGSILNSWEPPGFDGPSYNLTRDSPEAALASLETNSNALYPQNTVRMTSMEFGGLIPAPCHGVFNADCSHNSQTLSFGGGVSSLELAASMASHTGDTGSFEPTTPPSAEEDSQSSSRHCQTNLPTGDTRCAEAMENKPQTDPVQHLAERMTYSFIAPVGTTASNDSTSRFRQPICDSSDFARSQSNRNFTPPVQDDYRSAPQSCRDRDAQSLKVQTESVAGPSEKEPIQIDINAQRVSHRAANAISDNTCSRLPEPVKATSKKTQDTRPNLYLNDSSPQTSSGFSLPKKCPLRLRVVDLTNAGKTDEEPHDVRKKKQSDNPANDHQSRKCGADFKGSQKSPGRSRPNEERSPREGRGASSAPSMASRNNDLPDWSKSANEILCIQDHPVKGKRYFAAYLCVALEDLERFGRRFHAELEEWGFRIFLPVKDLLAKGNHFDNICCALEERCNGKIIIVLSKNFEASEECRFITYHAVALDPDTRKRNLIPVAIDDEYPVPNVLIGVTRIEYEHDERRGWLKKRLVEAIAA